MLPDPQLNDHRLWEESLTQLQTHTVAKIQAAYPDRNDVDVVYTFDGAFIDPVKTVIQSLDTMRDRVIVFEAVVKTNRQPLQPISTQRPANAGTVKIKAEPDMEG